MVTEVKKAKKGSLAELARLTEQVIKARRERKEVESKVAVLKKVEDAIKEFIIQNFSAAEVSGVKTKYGSLSMTEKDVPKVVDKEAFGRWIAKHEAWDCLYGKAVEAACAARWEENVEIEGVEKYHQKSLTITEVT